MALQDRDFDYLDLSFNKLSGQFSRLEATTNANSSQELYLEVNRLSGRFPSTPPASMGFGILSALRGNLFGCGNIPEEDEYSEEYSCGSEELDVSLYVFVSVVGVVMLVIFLLFVDGVRRNMGRRRGFDGDEEGHNILFQFLTDQNKYLSYLHPRKCCAAYDTASGRGKTALHTISSFCSELDQMTKLFVTLVCVYIVSSIPLYALKVSEYGLVRALHTTHSIQYRWVLTSAFLRGEVSLALTLCVWVCVLSVLSWVVVRDGVLRRWLYGSLTTSSRPPTAKREVQAKNNAVQDTNVVVDSTGFGVSASNMKLFAIFVVNVGVVGCIDGMYIHVTSKSLPPSTMVGLQVGMALFNLIWNMVAVPMLSRPMKATEQIVSTELGLLILNNIVLPCIVTALTSPECFQVGA